MSEKSILEKLIQDGKDAEARLKQLDRIRVPEGIVLAKIQMPGATINNSLGLWFNEKTQVLAYHEGAGKWVVRAAREDSPYLTTPLYLEPCSRSDLKAGDWHVNSLGSLGELMSYDLCLSNGQKAYVISNGTSVGNIGSGNYWKVVQ